MPKLADGIAGQLRRRRDLLRLDEPHARHAVGIDEEPQKRFAVAIDAADDLLLPQLPAVLLRELVEHLLHLHRDIVGRVLPLHTRPDNCGPGRRCS